MIEILQKQLINRLNRLNTDKGEYKMATVKLEKLLDYVWELSKETELKRNQELAIQTNIKRGLEAANRDATKEISYLQTIISGLHEDIKERDKKE